MSQSVDLRHNVYEFHRVVIGGELPPSPAVPDEGVARRRMRLIAEEFIEVLEAVYKGNPTVDEAIREVDQLIELIVTDAPINVNLVSLAHELADLEYVCEGAFLGFGIDSRPVHMEIQRANMAKLGGPIRADGKRMRPPGWVAPDVKSIIESQTTRTNDHDWME
jgi:predicted HAD superfamily Cof-like phosphohydrolase